MSLYQQNINSHNLTYEELKRYQRGIFRETKKGHNLTYEELKLDFATGVAASWGGS